MTARASKFAIALVPSALLACGIAELSRAATDPSPSVELTPPLDVSVSGPPDTIRDLSASDFVATLNGKETPVESAEVRCQLSESEPSRNSAQFFMYFDQTSLSLDSRHRAIQTATALVPRLVATGGEVAIVANGERLRLIAPPTTDGLVLMRTLEQLDQDENRLEVKRGSALPSHIPRSNREDRPFDPELSDRFAAMMGAFSAYGPSKVVLYFADHCWDESLPKRAAAFGGFRIHNFMTDAYRGSGRAMAKISADSGGIYFGTSFNATSIADRIVRAESCVYRLRFERSRVPADVELVTHLTATKANVKLDARAKWYAPTPDMISEERFAATLAAPMEHLEKPGLTVQVIPTGFKSGHHTGLVQVRLDAETAGGSAWEFAARGFSKAKWGETLKWRVVAPPPALPLMFEVEEPFTEGPYEVIAVARNIETGEIIARRFEGAMPTVHGARVAMSSIAVMQSGPCSCTRRLGDRQMAKSNAGAFALPLGEPLLTDRAALLVTLVCRGDGETTNFRVESSLLGGIEEVSRIFEADLATETCTQFRDKLPENGLKPGLYTYRVRVLAAGQEIGTAKRLFAAAAPTH